MIDLSTLNSNQLQAVLWDKGPLLVLAGPGSGKTRVLTYRIAHILEQSQDKHFRILALTFTNKAAAEMRNRVEELVPNQMYRVRLTTFHSFAAELLQQHGSRLNIRPDFQILSNDADRVAILDEVISQLRKGGTVDLPEHFSGTQIINAINRLLENCISADHVESILIKQNVNYALALARVYIEYRNALKRTNALDFPSLIAEVLDLLEKYPFITKHIRKVYKYILVDEFQDTNSSQYYFLSLLVDPDPSTLFVVADDDQIIYQWNGASPERIFSLRKNYGVYELQLPENYRCPPKVIELANSLIEKNLNRAAGKKPLKAIKQGTFDDVVRVFRFYTLDDEAKWIANDIANKDITLRQKCAVLARTNRLLEVVGEELKKIGIPVYYAVRKNDFKSAPFRMLHAILKLANYNEDKQSLVRLIKSFYEIEGIRTDLTLVISRASADGTDFLRAWLHEVISRDALSMKTRYLLTDGIKPLLNSLNYRLFAANLLEWATGYQNMHQQEELGFSEFDEERQVWQLLLSEIEKKFEGEEVSLNQFIHELDLSSKAPPKQPDAVPCFTIHASKGMEFGHVYLMGLVEDQLPSWNAIKKGDISLEMQEERRNCFVAITRAQESLTLTYSSEMFGRIKLPSRFLSEMGIEL